MQTQRLISLIAFSFILIALSTSCQTTTESETSREPSLVATSLPPIDQSGTEVHEVSGDDTSTTASSESEGETTLSTDEPASVVVPSISDSGNSDMDAETKHVTSHNDSDVVESSSERSEPQGDSDLVQAPGAVEGFGPSENLALGDEASPGASVNEKPWNTVSNADYSFTVSYPQDYLYRRAIDDEIAQYIPSPVDRFSIVNPQLPRSDVADIELPDLEITIFNKNTSTSLREWLFEEQVLFPGEGDIHPYSNKSETGLEVCYAIMIAPRCSYYFMGDMWVYQLTAVSPAGESAMQTFSLLE